MSYNINLQHIVFRTAKSLPSIPQQHKPLLLSYIKTVSDGMGIKMLRINAHKNHVHVLVDMPVDFPLSEYVRKIKQTASVAFRGHALFPQFVGWAVGYGSFSVSYYERDRIINYIKEQDEHHRVYTFREELERLFGKHFIDNDPYWRKNWED